MAAADFGKLSAPRAFLVRMLVFIVLSALVGVVIYQQVFRAFMANPVLNGLIFAVLFLGIAYGLQIGRAHV